MLTQQELKRILHYNPETGIWTRLVTLNSRAVKGTTTIGHKNKETGYYSLVLYKHNYMIHGLVLLYMEGEYVKNVDHKDTDNTNNKYDNLRRATYSENRYNSKIMSNNTSGYKGISFTSYPTEYFRATVNKEGTRYRKTFSVSLYSSKEAALAKAIAWVTYHRNLLHGEFVNHG
jgi:hypothetical protein